uniref:Peptidase aspartic putative domain-containing protein n=1 Tax=Anopheles quadriannulatus TaxID=34691 RepID=A0A182XPK9_ANOQN
MREDYRQRRMLRGWMNVERGQHERQWRGGLTHQHLSPLPEHLDELITFGLVLQHLCNHLSNAELKHYIMNPELLEEMVEKLPATRKLEWVRYSREYPCSTLEEFGRFMEDFVDEACEVTNYTPPKASQLMRVHHSNLEVPVAVKPTSTQEGANALRPYQSLPCLNCGETDHKVRQCESFKRLSLRDRLAAVKRWKLCHNCLTNHGAKPCRSRYTCGIEGYREDHCSLHRPTQLTTTQPAQFQMHRNESQTTLILVVPITLYNGDNQIDTHAFLDEGLSLTFVESSLAESLGLEGVPEPLELRWTANVERKETTSRKISLEISGRGDERRYSIAAAHTVNELSLPTNHLNFKTLISSYHYLQGLPVKAYEDGVPRMLIGLANVDLMKPLDTRSGQPGEPIAVKTVLGWAIYGPHGENTDQRQAATCN